MKQFFLLCWITIILSACGSSTNPSDQNNDQASEASTKLISSAEFADLLSKPDVQLIDVRTPDEVARGTIGGATNIDFRNGSFKNDILSLDPNKPVLLFCQSGGRSAKAAKLLEANGFQQVYDLEGGYGTWSELQVGPKE